MDDPVKDVLRAIADEPVRDGDEAGVAGQLRRLCSAVTRSLPASGAGVSVLAQNGVRGVTAVSEPAYAAIED